MKKFKYIYIVFAMAFLAACGYEPEVERAGSRPDITTTQLLDARGYSILNEAISHAGLDDVLQGSDSITLLAPTNEAFEILLSDLGVQSITDVPAENVANILSYHVIGSPAFSGGLPRSATALDGNTLFFSTANGVSVNGKAAVVEPDLVSNVAVVHGLNKVLDIPAGNLLQQMQANDSLSTLVTAIQAAGLESLFTGSTVHTIFAPTNSAFDGVDVNALTQAELVDILGFHVLEGANFSQELPVSGRLATIQGSTADEVQEIVKNEASLNGSALLSLNQVANNGIIHVVSGIISKQSTAADVFSATTNVTGFDTFGPDAFGSIVEGLGYGLSFADTLSYYTPLFGANYASFASDADALEYLENHTFEGRVNLWNLDNGTKISSINGSEYYIVTGSVQGSDVNYINGGARNAFTAGGVPTTDLLGTYYFSTFGLPNASFNPLPEENVVEVLASDADYSLFVALVERLGLTSTLSSGDLTVFPVSNTTFTDATGFTTVEQIDTLSNEDDAELLADLEEIALNHVVDGVNFSAHIAGFLPALETLGGTTLQFAFVRDATGAESIAIVTDVADPNLSNVGLVSVDRPANNGVIHEVDSFISF